MLLRDLIEGLLNMMNPPPLGSVKNNVYRNILRFKKFCSVYSFSYCLIKIIFFLFIYVVLFTIKSSLANLQKRKRLKNCLLTVKYVTTVLF